MNLSQKFVTLLLLISFLSMPFWLSLTEPYVFKPSPLKLYEVIHPTYYIGLAALILSIIILSVRAKENSHSILNPYLITAILATFYVEFPLIVLFEHPVSDQSIQLLPIFYILREGNIYMPNYLFPETISPQLFASIFIMITFISNPLENLNRISIFLLPLLITLFIYIFMRRLGIDERFIMMASVMNIGLIYFAFMFLRQTYTMLLYIMINLLILIASKGRRGKFSVLAIITSVAFIMSDPAFVIMTIAPLTLFIVLWKACRLLRRVNFKHFRDPWTFVVLISIMFLFWIMNRSNVMFINLLKIAEITWNVFIQSIREFSLPYSNTLMYGADRPTSITYNSYFMTLLEIERILRGLGIAIPTLILLYMLISKKTRYSFLSYDLLYLTAFFFVTNIILILKAYGVTALPWIAIETFYLLYISKAKSRLRINVLLVATLILILSAIVVTPQVINSGGGVSITDKSDHFLSWLADHSINNFSMTAYGLGSILAEVMYMKYGHYILVYDYLPLEGFTPEYINSSLNFKIMCISVTTLSQLEETNAIFNLTRYIDSSIDVLVLHDDLVYNSGTPEVTLWIKSGN